MCTNTTHDCRIIVQRIARGIASQTMTDRTQLAFGAGGGQHPHYGLDSHVNRQSLAQDPRYKTCSVGTKIDTSADIENRYESFILDDGQKKVEVDPETRECCTFDSLPANFEMYATY